jgi:hypothetical protein
MWNPQSLTTLQASTAYYRNYFTLLDITYDLISETTGKNSAGNLIIHYISFSAALSGIPSQTYMLSIDTSRPMLRALFPRTA